MLNFASNTQKNFGGQQQIPPFFTDPFVHCWSILPQRGTIPQKRGEYFCCPPKILCVLDANFNVDYDFAIKHDLIL